MTLYEIEQAYLDALEECLDMETGEILDQAKFEEVQSTYCKDKNAKIENIICLIKNKKAMAEAVKAEKLKLGDRQKVLENEVESLSNYLESILNGESFESAKGKVSFRKSESVEIDLKVFMQDENSKMFLKVKDPEPIKADIKKALKSGMVLKGATLVSSNNIQIK